MITIRRITETDSALEPGLCRLLEDSVNNGASVGFLAPLTPPTSLHYWRNVLDSLGADLALWVAERDSMIVGSVQLALSNKENGQHRAEVQKLLVLQQCRGQGIASRLMSLLESYAKNANRTLLVLDTRSGSDAELFYKRLNWQYAGEIPHFAASSNGTLLATALYYKLLGA